MKWIFALLFLFPSISFALESVPAGFKETPSALGGCTNFSNVSYEGISQEQCSKFGLGNVTGDGRYVRTIKSVRTEAYSHASYTHRTIYSLQVQDVWNGPFVDAWASSNIYYHTVSKQYSCPPDGNKEFTIGPVDLNGSKVCQKPPKVCLKGAIVRVTSDGKETCVPNCGAAAGLAHSGQYFFQAGPDAGSTAGEVKCYGQCSIQTIGGGVQLSSGAWTGSFTFTGANCSVVRPEPTLDSEDDTSSNGDAPPVDNSNTSQGTEDAMGELEGAASGATGTQVQPNATGPNGETTLKDVAKVVADSANAQIKATSEQNVATGKLVSNISKDIQNAIHNSGHGGGGASASLQAQGNGKLDGIKDALDQISDKLDKEEEGDGPFVPGSGSGAFWESVIPEASFTEIKEKQSESIQKIKDLNTEFQTSLKFTELSASGEPDEWVLNMNGTAMPFGMGAFQMILDMGLAAVVLLLCALYAVYIIANRK
ncbi:hypothetical protein LZT27_16685 [Aeromonas veronii]|uniref:hypothetical protein n=1 Tax=Aeromonas veronii TaxID=654 RepID=UPI0023641AB4|nr:hypothetical protein [Aeromonas veronii]MDD1846227.1 hypothetical protein [Aeromonas veronii]